MILDELVSQYRRDAEDRADPPMCSDADAVARMNEAEREACKRADLLHEADDEDLCSIATTEGTATYTLHVKLLRPTYITWTADGSDTATPLTIIDRVELQRIRPDWREDTEPMYVIVEDRKLRLCWAATSDGTLTLEGYRLPLENMSEDDDEPEISEAHQDKLPKWVEYRVYSNPGNEFADKDRAKAAYDEFERYFGPSKDAERMRAPENGPMFTKAWV